MIDQPPPVLDSARLLEYAEVDASVKYTGRIMVYVDGAELGAVPRLAICENMRGEPDTLLFYCDASWNVLAAGGYSSVREARASAETSYAGISRNWVKTPFSREEAERYFQGNDSDV